MSSTSDPSRMDPYSDDPGAAPGSTAVLDRQLQEQEQTTDDGDHDRFAHYVRKDKITHAALGGTPVIALCGEEWVPGRAPEKYPLGQECKEVYGGFGEPSDGWDGAGGAGKGGSGLGGFRGFFGGRR